MEEKLVKQRTHFDNMIILAVRRLMYDAGDDLKIVKGPKQKTTDRDKHLRALIEASDDVREQPNVVVTTTFNNEDWMFWVFKDVCFYVEKADDGNYTIRGTGNKEAFKEVEGVLLDLIHGKSTIVCQSCFEHLKSQHLVH